MSFACFLAYNPFEDMGYFLGKKMKLWNLKNAYLALLPPQQFRALTKWYFFQNSEWEKYTAYVSMAIISKGFACMHTGCLSCFTFLYNNFRIIKFTKFQVILIPFLLD